VGAEHVLGRRLVERDGEREHAGARVGQEEHLEERGHLALAAVAVVPLAEVEAEVGAGALAVRFARTATRMGG
jgi:hypothetical protein